MKIIYEHSHLNGKEYLQVHFPAELQEIVDVIKSIDGNVLKKSSDKSKNEKAIKSGLPHAEVYNQVAINKNFKDQFKTHGWKEKRYRYYATVDEHIAREVMSLPADDAKKIIEARGETAFQRNNQTDFVKSGIGIEVQFGKYAFVAYDFFVKHMTFFISGDINVGVEIIPTNKMLQGMDSGPANYEGEIFNLYRQGRNTPAVPLWILGIEP
ncbi:MAG: hypothetical protein LBS91_01905 [Clostridiales Family XIII bacterium]|jgi:hypothetical protein|nr:hypothetical protein [Clostridiales Family XIII bacterium]